MGAEQHENRDACMLGSSGNLAIGISKDGSLSALAISRWRANHWEMQPPPNGSASS